MPLKFDDEALFRLAVLMPAYKPAQFNEKPLLRGVPFWAVFDPVRNIHNDSAEPILLYLGPDDVSNFKREIKLGAEVIVRLRLEESVWQDRLENEGSGYFLADGHEFQVENFFEREPSLIRAVNRDSDIRFMLTLGYGQDAYAWGKAWRTENALQVTVRHFLTEAEKKGLGPEQSIKFSCAAPSSGPRGQFEVNMSAATAIRAGLSRDLTRWAWDNPCCPHLLEPEIQELLTWRPYDGPLEPLLKIFKDSFPAPPQFKVVFKRAASLNYQNILSLEVMDAAFNSLLILTPDLNDRQPEFRWEILIDESHESASYLLSAPESHEPADLADGSARINGELARFLLLFSQLTRERLSRAGLLFFGPGPAPLGDLPERKQPKFQLLSKST